MLAILALLLCSAGFNAKQPDHVAAIELNHVRYYYMTQAWGLQERKYSKYIIWDYDDLDGKLVIRATFYQNEDTPEPIPMGNGRWRFRPFEEDFGYDDGESHETSKWDIIADSMYETHTCFDVANAVHKLNFGREIIRLLSVTHQ